MNSPLPSDRDTSLKSPQDKSEVVCAFLALLGLGIVAALAFLATEVASADRIVLPPLGLAALVFWIPFVWRRIDAHSDIAAFALTATMFVIYQLARTSGPEDGFSLRFAALPEDQFVLPYSAYVVVVAAMISSPLWWRRRGEWMVSILAAITILAALAAFSFSLLKGYFPVGATEILDPTPLPSLAMNLVEYGCLALVCSAVAARRETRILALRLLPAILLLLWARHQFFAAPVDAEVESE